MKNEEILSNLQKDLGNVNMTRDAHLMVMQILNQYRSQLGIPVPGQQLQKQTKDKPKKEGK